MSPFVVPTTTSPFIWPSNGKILSGPYQIFWVLHIWMVFGYVYMTNCSYLLLLMIEGLKLYNLLSMLWLWWLVIDLNYPILMSWVIWWLDLFGIGSLLMVCLLFNSFEFLSILQKSSNWFVIAYPIHPSNDPFTLTKGCDFWPP